jgi:hypothetical protein
MKALLVMMNVMFFLDEFLVASWFHFLSSGIAGALAFLLTVIISFAVSRKSPGNAQRIMGLNLFTVGLGLCLAVLAAWFVHSRLDHFTTWWTAPIGRPLVIEK